MANGLFIQPDPAIERRKALAQAMMGQGMQQQPIQHWTQGVNQLAQALLGAKLTKGAEKEQQERRGAAYETISKALSPVQEPVGAMPVAAGGMSAPAAQGQRSFDDVIQVLSQNEATQPLALQLKMQRMTAQQPKEPFTLSPEQVRFDPTGRPIAMGLPKTKEPGDTLKTEKGLRAEFTKLTKDFRTIDDSFRRIGASAKNPSGAGDLSMIFNYMKMLDPNSVVRESEFATAAATGSYGQVIQGHVQKALTGEKLADEVRDDFVRRAQMLYSAQERGYNQIRDQYGTLAKRAGVSPKDVLVEFRPPKEKKKPARLAGVPEVPSLEDMSDDDIKKELGL